MFSFTSAAITNIVLMYVPLIVYFGTHNTHAFMIRYDSTKTTVDGIKLSLTSPWFQHSCINSATCRLNGIKTSTSSKIFFGSFDSPRYQRRQLCRMRAEKRSIEGEPFVSSTKKSEPISNSTSNETIKDVSMIQKLKKNERDKEFHKRNRGVFNNIFNISNNRKIKATPLRSDVDAVDLTTPSQLENATANQIKSSPTHQQEILEDETNITEPSFSSSEKPKHVKSSKAVTHRSTNSYFPSYPLLFPEKDNYGNGTSSRKKKKTSASISSKKSLPSPSPLIYEGKSLDPNATLTVSQLTAILEQNGFLKRSDSDFQTIQSSLTTNKVSFENKQDKEKDTRRKSKGVAFPQESILTKKAVIQGTTFVSGVIGIILGRSIAPSTWLVGFVVGLSYGNHVGKKYESRLLLKDDKEAEDADISIGFFPELVLRMGKRLAKYCLLSFDAVNGIWFMYKTGQLSYEYYKTYESLDKTFQIQNKVDAWNTRFQEGKINFDKWEQDNEVGRKMLAGLRTVWLVEEKSYRRTLGRGKGKRKLRIMEYISDTASFFNRLARALLNFATGGGSKELKEVLRGIKVYFSELNFEYLGEQIGSGLAALVAINLVGAIFTVAPSFLGVVFFTAGMIWPTWVSGAYRRVTKTIKDTAEKGRRELAFSVPQNKGKYHYFAKEDGTKRWYRTGKPIFDDFFESDNDGEKNSRNGKGIFDIFSTTSSVKEKEKPGISSFLNKIQGKIKNKK